MIFIDAKKEYIPLQSTLYTVIYKVIIILCTFILYYRKCIILYWYFTVRINSEYSLVCTNSMNTVYVGYHAIMQIL